MRPIFSDSPFKNMIPAKIWALEDLFWPIIWFCPSGVKMGQNRSKFSKNIFSLKSPNYIRFAWKPFLRPKIMSAIFFWLIFDQKRLCFPIVQKSFLGPYRLQKSSKSFLIENQPKNTWLTLFLILKILIWAFRKK